MGASLQCFPFIPPTHPQVPRERSSACPACCPSLSPSDQSQVLTGTLPLFPLPPSPLLPWNAPSQDWAKPCGPVPTHPPFPHIRDAGNAHFWVSIANTPLPKHPSCPVRHTRSPQPLLPPRITSSLTVFLRPFFISLTLNVRNIFPTSKGKKHPHGCPKEKKPKQKNPPLILYWGISKGKLCSVSV